MILLKLFMLTLSFILLGQPVFAQSVTARVEFSKNASSMNGMVPQGSEGEYLSSTLLAATPQRPAVHAIKVRLTKISPQQGTRVRAGDEVWVYHTDSALTFKDLRGRPLENVENTLFKSKVTQPVIGAVRPLAATPAPPPPPPPTKKPTAAVAAVAAPNSVRAAPGVDPNLAMPDRSKRETEANFCPSGRCVSGNVVEEPAITEVEKINKALARHSSNPWSAFPGVSQYSENPKVVKMIRIANSRSNKRSVRMCYRYVKQAMMSVDALDQYPTGRKAIDGIKDLKAEGWSNMMDNPKYKGLIKGPDDAPKGTILVYRDTNNKSRPGHIEIKTDHGEKGGYVSDFFRGTDTNLRARELVGVMIKENL